MGTGFRFRNQTEIGRIYSRIKKSGRNIQSLTNKYIKMKTTDLKDKSIEDPDYKSRQIEKIKTDLYHIREVIDMMDFLIEKKCSDRLISYMPELKTYVKSLKKNTKRYLS